MGKESMRDRFYHWLAWRLPKMLVYFCAIRVWAAATTGQYRNTNIDTLTIENALRRWDGKKDKNRTE